MNAIEAYKTEGPFGESEDCAKLTIDNVSAPFVMHDVMISGRNYVFSCWIRSDEPGILKTIGCEQETGTTWSKYESSFNATGADLSLIFPISGAYYLYHTQLELGTIASDWTEAPEDISDRFISTERLIRELSTDLTQTAEGIYIDITRIDGGLDETKKTLKKHFSFTNDGIRISAGKNEMTLRIDNDIIIFEKDNVFYGWWDGENFHTGNIEIDVNEQARFGNFAFVPRTDGSLSFLKVSDDKGIRVSRAASIMVIRGAETILEDTTLNLHELSGTLDGTTLILGGG